MSLRWNRSVRLRIEVHSVMATLRQGWPRPSTVARAHEWVEPSSEISAHPGFTEMAPQLLPVAQIEAVFETLKQTGALRGASLSVEISDALVLLDVIDGDFLGNTDRQLDAIAAACAAELLGDPAGEQEIRWQLQSDDRHLLMCAMPRTYVQELSRIAQTYGLKLASVEPDFVRQWNRHSQVLGTGQGVFAVATRAHVAVAWATKGVISALSAGPLGPPSSAENPHGVFQDSLAPLVEEERVERVEQLASKIDSMMSEFGLITRPASLDEQASAPQELNRPVSALDRRVDRLLAGLGQDASTQTAFVLVTSDPTRLAISERWQVHRGVKKIHAVATP